MYKQMFEIAALYHEPSGNHDVSTKTVVEPKTVLACSEEEAKAIAYRELSAECMENFQGVQVIVRRFEATPSLRRHDMGGGPVLMANC